MPNLIAIASTTCPISAQPEIGAGFIIGIILLAVWSIIWKGLALWKSAKNQHKVWFIIMLIVNTVGILEILYYFIFSKPKNLNQNNAPTSPTSTSL